MRNPIKQLWHLCDAKAEQKRIRYLIEEFDVEEKCGAIYLTHNGVAFERIDSDMQAGAVADKLNAARQTAQEYRTL